MKNTIKPIINPSSEKTLLAIINKLPQSLLITGDNGVGISTVAKYISQFRNVKPTIILPEKDEKIDLEKGSITINSIRRLYDEVRTKTTNERIIIIDYAERMNHQAQNAFLKLLEEPNELVYFIMVSHSTSKLLPTIISRVEHLYVKPITNKQSNQLLDSLKINNKLKRSQLIFMADGLPAELTHLSTDDEYFNNRSKMIKDARELLSGKAYDKLLLAHEYKDSRSNTLLLLADASNILKKSIVSNPKPDAINYIDKLLRAYERIEANGNIRLCLTRLVF